jgi:hypothetical protein
MASTALTNKIVGKLPSAPNRDQLIATQAHANSKWAIPGRPPVSSELTLALISNRTAAVAAQMVTKLDNPDLLTAVAVSDKRRVVMLALASNPALPQSALSKVLDYGATQPQRAREKIASALFDAQRPPETEVALMAANQWLITTSPGQAKVEDCAKRLGTSSLETIRLYPALTPNQRNIDSALHYILNGHTYGKHGKVLPVDVVCLYFDAQNHRQCLSGCHAVADWAKRARPAAFRTLLKAAVCPCVSASLIAHYQKSKSKTALSRLADLVDWTFAAKEVTDVATSFLPRWLTELANAGGVIDVTLAHRLNQHMTRFPDEARISIRQYPDVDPPAATELAQSPSYHLAFEGIRAIADPHLRCRLATQQINADDNVAPYRVNSLLVELADTQAMYAAIAKLDKDDFATWAQAIWYKMGSTKLPTSFISRVVRELDLEMICEAVEHLTKAQLNTLVSRIITAAPGDNRDYAVELVLENQSLDLSDKQIWQLVTIASPHLLPRLLPNGTKPTVLQAHDLARLTAVRPDAQDELLAYLHKIGYAPWQPEALDALPLKWEYLTDGAWELLDSRFASAFGTNEHHWVIATGLLETWNSTLDDLIDTTLTLS